MPGAAELVHDLRTRLVCDDFFPMGAPDTGFDLVAAGRHVLHPRLEFTLTDHASTVPANRQPQ